MWLSRDIVFSHMTVTWHCIQSCDCHVTLYSVTWHCIQSYDCHVTLYSVMWLSRDIVYSVMWPQVPSTELHLKEKWFHGKLANGRPDAERLLADYQNVDGSFLVRESATFTGDYSLSFAWVGVANGCGWWVWSVYRVRGYCMGSNTVKRVSRDKCSVHPSIVHLLFRSWAFEKYVSLCVCVCVCRRDQKYNHCRIHTKAEGGRTKYYLIENICFDSIFDLIEHYRVSELMWGTVKLLLIKLTVETNYTSDNYKLDQLLLS